MRTNRKPMTRTTGAVMASKISRPRQAVRMWAESVVPVEDADDRQKRRERVVPHLANVIAENAAGRARARRRVQIWSAVACAAAVVVGTGSVWRARVRAGNRAVVAEAPR